MFQLFCEDNFPYKNVAFKFQEDAALFGQLFLSA